MVDPVNLVWISVDAVLAIEHEGVRLDAVPQFERHIEEFLGADIAFVVIHHVVEAVIRRFVLVG